MSILKTLLFRTPLRTPCRITLKIKVGLPEDMHISLQTNLSLSYNYTSGCVKTQGCSDTCSLAVYYSHKLLTNFSHASHTHLSTSHTRFSMTSHVHSQSSDAFWMHAQKFPRNFRRRYQKLRNVSLNIYGLFEKRQETTRNDLSNIHSFVINIRNDGGTLRNVSGTF